jgi:Transposase IS66 family
MSKVELEQLLRDAEALLAGSGELPAPAAKAVGMLLNAVEALCSDKQELLEEVERLRQQLEGKKRGKPPQDPGQVKPGNFSSEKRRTDSTKPPLLRDRRSGKELEIHQTIACPVDVTSMSADAVRVADESVIVQNVVIEPHNIEFRKEVYFSASENEYYRGTLPVGFDEGDFGPDLRALILSLKYCGNMSEPKIGELLENFGVEVSSGSLSNILTKTADQFEETYHQVLLSGLSSTTYQQTDDTSARVAGQSWHTHIICNPFYTFYSTRPGKDRLNVLCALQNVSSVRYRFNHQTLNLLDQEFEISAKWRAQVHSRSPRGAHSMDVFTTIVQTCKKMGASAYEYFRLHLCHASQAPDLPQMILTAAGAQ